MLEPQQGAGDIQTGIQTAAQPGTELAPQSAPALDLPAFSDGALDFFGDDFAEEAAPPKPWYRRPLWIAVISGVVLVALLVGGFAIARGQRQPITYQYANVATGNLTISIGATGPLQAATYGASFAVSGRIAEIDVRLGQQVTAGQQLAKLDDTQLQTALRQAQIQADQAYIQEQNALANCDKPGVNDPASCKQSAYDAFQLALIQLQNAQDNLKNATLYAPHAGLVSAINGNVGGTPGSGSSSGGTSGANSGSGTSSGASGFIIIADTTALQVVASVNEADIGNVAIGQPAAFTVTAYPNRQFSGAVSLVSPAAQTTSNVVTYPVVIDVDMTKAQGVNLLPGMTATITINRAQRNGVLLIPAAALSFARSAVAGSSALIPTSDLRSALTQARQMLGEYQTAHKDAAQDNPTAAFVLERAGQGQRAAWTVKPVVVGLSNGSVYEALAGLSQGEQIVVGQSGGTTGTPGAGGRGGLFGGGGGRNTGGGNTGGGNGGR